MPSADAKDASAAAHVEISNSARAEWRFLGACEAYGATGNC